MLIRISRFLFVLGICIVSKNVSSQNIGIGVASPDERLHVDSVIRIGKNAVIPPNGQRKNMIKFGDVDYVYISEQDRDDRLVFRAGAFSFRNGNVGIGIDSATAALDVSGSIRIRNTSGTAGQVLTSDAQGFATWKAPASTSFLSSGDLVTFPNNVNTKVPFTTDIGESSTNFDDFGTFNNTTHSFTVPATGVYHYDAIVRLNTTANATANGLLSIRLFVNGSGVSHAAQNTNRAVSCVNGQPIPTYISTSGLVKLNASDIVEVYFSQSSGVSIDIWNAANSNFSMFRVK